MIDQHSTLAEKFLKKGFWLYLFSFIIAPVWYIIKIILSGELTVSEMWILYWIISLIALISAFNDFWMTESLNHFLPDFITKKEYNKVKSILTYALISQLSTWIIIASFFYFGADFIATHYFESNDAINILKIFSLYFLWINLFQIHSTFFMAVQNTFANKIIELVRMLFVLSSILFLFLNNIGSIITYSYAWIIWLYAWILFAASYFYKKYYRVYLIWEKILWNTELFSKIFKYAILVFIWAQAGTILGQMDMQMIIYLLGTQDAGYYTNYLSIVGIPFLVITPVFGLLFPIFSEMHSKKEYDKIRMIKNIFTKNFIVIWLTFNIFLFIFAEIIAYTLFWEKFITSGSILRYSILFLVFNFLIHINGNILSWIWKIKDKVKVILMAVGLNFITNLILIQYIWVGWAALATWIWWIFIWGMFEYYLWKDFYVKLDFIFIIKNILFLSSLWWILFIYILPIIEELSRIYAFFSLAILWMIWFWLFYAFNYNHFKWFILEIKKLRQ